MSKFRRKDRIDLEACIEIGDIKRPQKTRPQVQLCTDTIGSYHIGVMLSMRKVRFDIEYYL